MQPGVLDIWGDGDSRRSASKSEARNVGYINKVSKYVIFLQIVGKKSPSCQQAELNFQFSKRQDIEAKGLSEGILFDRNEWRKLIHVPDPT